MQRCRLSWRNIWRCAQTGNTDRLKVLIAANKAEFPFDVRVRDFELKRALAVGVRNNHHATVSLLLAEGADPFGHTSQQWWHSFYHLSTHTDDRMAQILLRAARTTSTAFDREKMGIWGAMDVVQTPAAAFALHAIMKKECPDPTSNAYVCGFTTAFGNICCKDKGPRFKVVAALLQCKANVNGTLPPFHVTPLHAACRNPCRPRFGRLVALLLRAKADANAKTHYLTGGKTPRDRLLQGSRKHELWKQQCAVRLLADAERGVYPASKSTSNSKAATTSKATCAR